MGDFYIVKSRAGTFVTILFMHTQTHIIHTYTLVHSLTYTALLYAQCTHGYSECGAVSTMHEHMSMIIYSLTNE